MLDISLDSILVKLADQNAPASHLKRITDLRAIFVQSPSCIAAALVGSYAHGSGDRISDLDVVAFTANEAAEELLTASHAMLLSADVLYWYAGANPAKGGFRKYIFLDFSSCELHVTNVPTEFKLCHPYISIFDRSDLLPKLEVDNPPPRHEDFDAYQHGDVGLIWELFDCIKWLKRGRVQLAKSYLQKLTERL